MNNRGFHDTNIIIIDLITMKNTIHTRELFTNNYYSYDL